MHILVNGTLVLKFCYCCFQRPWLTCISALLGSLLPCWKPLPKFFTVSVRTCRHTYNHLLSAEARGSLSFRDPLLRIRDCCLIITLPLLQLLRCEVCTVYRAGQFKLNVKYTLQTQGKQVATLCHILMVEELFVGNNIQICVFVIDLWDDVRIVEKLEKLSTALGGRRRGVLHSSQKSVGKLGQNCVYLSLQSGPDCVLEQVFLQAIMCSKREQKDRWGNAASYNITKPQIYYTYYKMSDVYASIF